MGDMADWLTEQGEDAHNAHLTGQCDGWCQYCREQDILFRKKSKPKKKKTS